MRDKRNCIGGLVAWDKNVPAVSKGLSDCPLFQFNQAPDFK